MSGMNDLVLPDGSPLCAHRAAGPFAGTVEIVFDDIARRICSEIYSASRVIACVAWISDRDILATLADCESVDLIVAKERHLRSDDNGFDPEVRRLIDALPRPGIRCVGEVRRQGSEAGILHSKFAVLDARRVLAGSYNWTYGARRNREVLMVIDSRKVAGAMLDEHARLAALAEPLDWRSEWSDPRGVNADDAKCPF